MRKIRVVLSTGLRYIDLMNATALLDRSENYRRIEQTIRYLEANFKKRPTLDEVARAVCLSPFHFQRLFKRWAGVSPVQFMQFLTLDYAKTMLAESRSLLDVSLAAGLSGPGRLHDLFVTFEAATPGDFKRQGRGLKIEYGFHPTPFGECLLATTSRGICHLGFGDDENRRRQMRPLLQKWPRAILVENAAASASVVKDIFASSRSGNLRPFHLLLKGTNFQINVWRALLSIPRGRLVSYQDIATLAGHPRAVRAAAGAVAQNPVAYLIPCHRVITKSGKIHKYRWGAPRKKAMLGWEAARLGR